MPSPLAEAHIEASARLRGLVSTAVAGIWTGLPGHDRANVDEWLTKVVPVIHSGQRASIALTDGYLARFLSRPPLGLKADELIANGRNGTPLAVAYERPFVELWSKLGAGIPFATASTAALTRAQGMAEFDVQAAMRDTAQAIGQQDNRIERFQRVADGDACDFCQEVDGAVLNSDDAMPLHNRCGCGIEPLEEAQPVTATPDAVAIHDHGELGPVLGAPGDHFTSEAQLH